MQRRNFFVAAVSAVGALFVAPLSWVRGQARGVPNRRDLEMAERLEDLARNLRAGELIHESRMRADAPFIGAKEGYVQRRSSGWRELVLRYAPTGTTERHQTFDVMPEGRYVVEYPLDTENWKDHCDRRMADKSRTGTHELDGIEVDRPLFEDGRPITIRETWVPWQEHYSTLAGHDEPAPEFKQI